MSDFERRVLGQAYAEMARYAALPPTLTTLERIAAVYEGSDRILRVPRPPTFRERLRARFGL